MAEVVAVDSVPFNHILPIGSDIDYMMHVEAFSFGFGFVYKLFIMAEAPPRACTLDEYMYVCRVIGIISNIDHDRNK
jgi:hypothetical protein